MRAFQFQIAVVACLAILSLNGCLDDSEQTIIGPAYRPHSENATVFRKALETATIAVYPSIVRTLEETSYSVKSQQQIVSLLNDKQITTAVARAIPVDPGVLVSGPQWAIFQNDMHKIADELKRQKSDTNYSLVMAIVFPPGNQSIFGIHCYIINHKGENAFSFLLNSHHPLFVEANLTARNSSETSRAMLIEKATRVGLHALIKQLEAPEPKKSANQQGYTITTQKISPFDKDVDRIFIITSLHKRLMPVFMHSFKHSLISAFESNGVEAVVKFTSKESDALEKFRNEAESFKPDATMQIFMDPLYRSRKDGYQAIVGTDFEANVLNMKTKKTAWTATGKVDYIEQFGQNYTAHEGIRKEFAWHTTAAIVRTFMADVNGKQSAPIYTVTEERQLYRQSTD